MATYNQLADRIDLEVCTRNEQLFARLRGRFDVTVTIVPGYAERAGDTETAAQLDRLSRLLFAHRAERLNRIGNETLEPLSTHRHSAKDTEFERRYAEITVTESAADGAVGLTVVGLSRWSWTIEPGTVERLGSEGVAEHVTDIANRVVRRLADEVHRLKIDVFHSHG